MRKVRGWVMAAAAAAFFAGAAHGQSQPESFTVAAPELTGAQWLNTPKNAPLPLASLKGKVTVVHFWTFG